TFTGFSHGAIVIGSAHMAGCQFCRFENLAFQFDGSFGTTYANGYFAFMAENHSSDYIHNLYFSGDPNAFAFLLGQNTEQNGNSWIDNIYVEVYNTNPGYGVYDPGLTTVFNGAG